MVVLSRSAPYFPRLSKCSACHSTSAAAWCMGEVVRIVPDGDEHSSHVFPPLVPCQCISGPKYTSECHLPPDLLPGPPGLCLLLWASKLVHLVFNESMSLEFCNLRPSDPPQPQYADIDSRMRSAPCLPPVTWWFICWRECCNSHRLKISWFSYNL